MLNREYHKRAAAQGETPFRIPGGVNHLPWAGLFEPWKPFVLVAAAREELETGKQAKRPVLDKSAARRCKKSSQRLLFDGKLRGVQLSLFPDETSS